MLLWFSPGGQSPLADSFATGYLLAYAGDGTGTDGHAKATDLAGSARAYTSAGLRTTYAGPAAEHLFGARRHDERVPDLVGIVQHGVVYTSKTAKIAEHGGNDPQDRHVPLVVAGPGVAHAVRTGRVETTSIAPTILALLGLDPRSLRAVRIEGTRALRLR
ncbi:MAG: hypothetical protein ABI873_11770 [Marmoricola sp.]